jgi:hypothetical protein
MSRRLTRHSSAHFLSGGMPTRMQTKTHLKIGLPRIRAILLALADERRPDKTFCPSEAARRLAPDTWRECLPMVRDEAMRLVRAGKLRCTQCGREVNAATARGPLRFPAVNSG